MMPWVALRSKPNGEPIASTHWPTLTLRMSAMRTAGRGVLVLTLSRATSLRLSLPISSAGSSLRSFRPTVMLSMFSTTWALVTT